MNYSQGCLIDPLILSEEDILLLYRKAYNLMLQGQVYVEFSGEGTEFKTAFPIPVEQMMSECRYALKQGWPAKYGHILTEIKPFFA